MKYVVRGNYIFGGTDTRIVNGVDAARHNAKWLTQSSSIDKKSIIAFRMKDEKHLDLSDITGIIDMEVEA